MSHTPGPWNAEQVLNGAYLIFGNTDNERAIAETRIRWIDNEECANAALIAAAPDLLAVCKAIIREDGHYLECPCTGEYSHEFMPHSPAVEICKQLRFAINATTLKDESD
jgi:hypothetical protein